MLQSVLDGLDVPVRLELPYQFKPKGQMLNECLNQPLLQQLAADSTSCGRFRTYNRKHCGRCVPCMIRKAAFIAWDPARDTTGVRTPSLANAGKASGPDDGWPQPLPYSRPGKRADRFLGASLAFAEASCQAGIQECNLLMA